MTRGHAPRVAGVVWHYTTGQSVRGIISTGSINPAEELVPSGEIPAVWFSRRKTWEPTASKGIFDPRIGTRRFATLAEMEERCGGLFRFGIDTASLLNWPRLVLATGMSCTTARHLERVGRKAGAVPSDWMGRVGPVALTELESLQRLVKGRWISDVSELNEFEETATELNTVVH